MNKHFPLSIQDYVWTCSARSWLLLGIGAQRYPNLKLAGLIEEMVVLGNSDSPGGLHYVIHSYDQPPFASRALESANRYLNISVEVPHALHMPSHIYGDLGLWEDMINANILSLNLAFSKASEPTGCSQEALRPTDV